MRVLVVVAALTIVGSAAEAKASFSQQTSVSCTAKRDEAGLCSLPRPPEPVRLAQDGGAAGGGGAGGGSGDGSSGGTYGDGSSGGTYGRHGIPYHEDEREEVVEDAMRACRQATAQQLDIQEADVTQIEGALDTFNPRLLRMHWSTVNQTRGDCSFEYGRVTFWGVTGSGE